jgi:hypothetical protein
MLLLLVKQLNGVLALLACCQWTQDSSFKQS